MADAGILSFGAYVPRKRLQRSAIHATNGWFAPGLKGLAKGERAIADWDEDSVTLAAEAARQTLGDLDRTTLGSLSLASTTLPFADRLNAGIVKEALVLDDAVGAFDLTGSQRAATSGLIQTLAAASDRPHLSIAAEVRKSRPASEGEMTSGDAAAAVLVGKGDVVARFLGAHSETFDFIDHFRASGVDFDYGWEARWIRDEGYGRMLAGALSTGLAKLDIAASSVDRLVVPITTRGVAEMLAKSAGVRPEAIGDPLAATVGDSGVAHPFLLLATALAAASPGETIVVIGFGQGVDVLAFETTAALADLPQRENVLRALARRTSDSNYARYLFHRGLLDLDRGMRAEFDQKQPGTTLWRNRKTVLGLVGGRCTVSGAVQFPRSDISVASNAREVGTQEDYPLADRPAKIVTFTADALTYSPSPPSYYGMIDFEGGGRIMAEFADIDPEQVEVGRAMRMMFRIKAIDERRDFVKYFWKAVPVD